MNIVVKLSGGFGNQLFQYGTARSLALRHGRPLVVDLHWYHDMPAGSTPRTELLSQLAIVASFDDSRGDPARLAPPAGNWWQRLLKPVQIVREKRYFHPEPRLRHLRRSVPSWYLDGYWQCHTYLDPIRDTLLAEVRPRRPMKPGYLELAARIEASESVMLHVRRGDYASTAAMHGTLPLAYYARATAHVREHCRAPVVFVFSDDPQWAREHIATGTETVFVESQPGDDSVIDELMLMRRCKHQIIANSSLSWWGAWLNENPDKIVTAPARWLADEAVELSDLIPPRWTVLPIN